jgi:hypothetical protein
MFGIGAGLGTGLWNWASALESISYHTVLCQLSDELHGNFSSNRRIKYAKYTF